MILWESQSRVFLIRHIHYTRPETEPTLTLLKLYRFLLFLQNKISKNLLKGILNSEDSTVSRLLHTS